MTQVDSTTVDLATALQIGLQNHLAGRLPQAASIYRQILNAQPNHADALHLLGVIAHQVKKYDDAINFIKAAIIAKADQPGYYSNLGEAYRAKGELAEAAKCYREALRLNPDFYEALNNLGTALMDQGDSDQAVECFQKAAKLRPDSPEVHNNLGIAHKNLGQLEEAVQRYRTALKLKPGYPEAHNNLGNALEAQGKLDEAIKCYHQALHYKPDFHQSQINLREVLLAHGKEVQDAGDLQSAAAQFREALRQDARSYEAYNNLGVVAHKQNRLDDAIAYYRQALELKPDYVWALTNMGAVHDQRGEAEQAAACYRQALQTDPNMPQALNNLACILRNWNRFDEALSFYLDAIRVKPDFGEAYENLGNLLKDRGRLEEARSYYHKALQTKEPPGIKVKLATLMPAIMESREGILESRANLEAGIDALLQEKITLTDPLTQVGSTNFYLAFHGLDDKPLQSKIARFYGTACPSLLFEAPHIADQIPGETGPIRVGFISRYLHNHSVMRCFGKVLEKLAEDKTFEVYALGVKGAKADDYSSRLIKNCIGGDITHLSGNFVEARQQIAALRLDALIYLDIGMDPYTYFLAFSRLARVQCVMTGHPVTTGIQNLDYFLSWELAEPDDADEHYTETLIRLPSSGSIFTRPNLPSTFKSREQLGLATDRNLYMCPMKLQKIHPDFDAAVANILQRDGKGEILFFKDHAFDDWHEKIERRFDRGISPEVRKRVRFVSWVADPLDFISTVNAADVILDPFHFGVGNTAIATVAAGSPIVTRPSRYMRGRVGLGLSTWLDVVEECVAADDEDYAKKAVAIATDKSLRQAVREKILAHNDQYFDRMTASEEMKVFLLKALNPAQMSRAISIAARPDVKV